LLEVIVLGQHYAWESSRSTSANDIGWFPHRDPAGLTRKKIARRTTRAGYLLNFFAAALAPRKQIADFKRLSDENQESRKQREDKMAKGQLRSGREKKKPKAEKNRKKKSAPAASPFSLVGITGKDASGKKFS